MFFVHLESIKCLNRVWEHTIFDVQWICGEFSSHWHFKILKLSLVQSRAFPNRKLKLDALKTASSKSPTTMNFNQIQAYARTPVEGVTAGCRESSLSCWVWILYFTFHIFASRSFDLRVPPTVSRSCLICDIEITKVTLKLHITLKLRDNMYHRLMRVHCWKDVANSLLY